MPVAIPTSTGTNWKVAACGLPIRTLVKACACARLAGGTERDRSEQDQTNANPNM